MVLLEEIGFWKWVLRFQKPMSAIKTTLEIKEEEENRSEEKQRI